MFHIILTQMSITLQLQIIPRFIDFLPFYGILREMILEYTSI